MGEKVPGKWNCTPPHCWDTETHNHIMRRGSPPTSRAGRQLQWIYSLSKGVHISILTSFPINCHSDDSLQVTSATSTAISQTKGYQDIALLCITKRPRFYILKRTKTFLKSIFVFHKQRHVFSPQGHKVGKRKGDEWRLQSAAPTRGI